MWDFCGGLMILSMLVIVVNVYMMVGNISFVCILCLVSLGIINVLEVMFKGCVVWWIFMVRLCCWGGN